MSNHTSPTREQINESAALYGYRLPTEADRPDRADVKALYENMRALHAGTITVDEARACNRAMRERLGETKYRMAHNTAVATFSRA